MNYDETLEYISSFTVFAPKVGRDNYIQLLELMGNPQNKLKFVHIAGTNGKGSTSSMLSNILQESGYKTGLFISPYIVCFRERMQINGEMIDQKELCDCAEYVKTILDNVKSEKFIITHFELITAIAFEWFNRNGCDIVCLEVGLGGRLDATNVIECPLVHVITSIGYDHTAILGDSLSKIAYEKAGIIKGSTTVIYPIQEEEAMRVLNNCCKEKNSIAVIPNLKKLVITDLGWKSETFTYNEICFEKKLPGNFQVYNAITAYHSAVELRKLGYNIHDNNIVDGIRNTFFPARMEILRKDPLIILDGAHNISGVKALFEALKDIKCKSINIIIGVLEDRNYEKMLSVLLPLADNVIATAPDNPRALDVLKLTDASKKYCNNVFMASNNKEALELALAKTSVDDAIIICGSLYLASAMRDQFINNPKL